jgi:hypothetical protein
MNSDTGKYIMLCGAAVVVIGLIIYFFHDKLHWIGHLPGEFKSAAASGYLQTTRTAQDFEEAARLRDLVGFLGALTLGGGLTFFFFFFLSHHFSSSLLCFLMYCYVFYL